MTLLEREPALEALKAALGEAAHGEGRVALVYGEAGIGKTSLVDSFARARGQPGRTLWGTCDSLHTPRPLGPVHDIAQQAGSALLGRLEAGAPPRVIFGAMGIHYVNGDLVGDGKLDASHPEALMYEPKGGKLELVGVEYIVIAAAWDAANKTPPTLMGQLFHHTPSPNRYGIPAFYALHVWAWRSNPHGIFVDWNPKVSCEGHTAGAATQSSSAHGARH